MRKFLFFVVFFFFIVFFLPLTKAFAQESIRNFDVTLTAHQDGRMSVEERIVYDFGISDRHGIFRYIPLLSSVGDLYRVIEIDFTSIQRDGEDEPYEVDRSSEQVEVKIGDADRTISGPHTYTISYTVENGIGSNYEDHDEIYWNVTGNGWEVPIASASVTLITDFAEPVGDTICFTGLAGATERNCSVTQTNGGKKVVMNGPLNSYEGLTFVSSFPVNTFPKSTLQKDLPLDPDLKIFLWIAIPLLLILNFVLAPYLIYWYLKKKNKKRFGKPVVNFDLPEHPKGERILPAEAGTIDNTKLDKDDIVATIFDLAIRKYIRIEQAKEKGKVLGIGKSEDHKLIKLKDFTDLTEFEKSLMNSLFSTGDSVLLKAAPLIYTEFHSLEKKNFESLIKRGFYIKNPATQKGGFLAFGIITLSFGNIILGPVLLWLSRKLNGRTQLGDEMDWKTDGLKLFLKATNRYNTWQAKNFIFLEKMIPYAIALGFMDQYMKQLKVLKPDYHPTWYRGSGNFYSTYPLFASTMSSNVTTSAPSSSSGFSGGSSGGGGGGGGGGSW